MLLFTQENLVIVARADCSKNINLCQRFGTTSALRFIPIIDGKIQKSEVCLSNDIFYKYIKYIIIVKKLQTLL